jgi:excisionase family DNA binding protein
VTVIAMPAVLLTVEEAAELLRLGRTTVYALIKSGELASVPVGRLRRIRPADLAAYANSLTPTTPLPLAAVA